MKKKYLFSIVALIILSACQKETATENHVITESEIAKAFLYNYNSVVIFANIKIDHDNNLIKGYFIDKKSNLTFLSEMNLKELEGFSLENGEIPTIPLISLYSKSVIEKSLDPIEVQSYLKKAMSWDQFAKIESDNKDAGSSYYKLWLSPVKVSTNESHACAHVPYYTDLVQILVQASGQMIMDHENILHQEIVDWIDSFDKKYSFLN